jgi:pimeloyl-ACP methyl ester carboxylesterase
MTSSAAYCANGFRYERLDVGGMLALDLARYHADDFRAVISLEGGLKVELPEGATDASFANPDPAAHAATMMMIMSPTAPEAYRHETRLHYAQGAPGVFGGDIFYYALDHDLLDEADHIDTARCAVHLLTGEYDFFTVPWTEKAGALIPGATCRIMQGLGHFPMSEDHEQLMQYVLPILDGISAT